MSRTFSMFFLNIEKVWDVEKCWNLCFLQHKLFKKQGKNNRVPTFFYVFLKKNIERFWDSVIFCLHFSEFGYVPYFFYVPNFFYDQKKKKREDIIANFITSLIYHIYVCIFNNSTFSLSCFVRI